MSLDEHLKNISKSRLKPYEQLCVRLVQEMGDKIHNEEISVQSVEWVAICVYTALQHRVCIFTSIIQEIEIAVRNEISYVMEKKCGGKQHLKDEFHRLEIENRLPQKAKKQLKDCLKKFKNENKEYSADDIIANLTFGFWVMLLNQKKEVNPQYQYWYELFNKNLFNNRFASMKNIYTVLKEVQRFRNKLYHQEPVWKGKNINTPEKALQKLEKTYRNFNNYLEKIAPERKKMRDISKLQSRMNELNFDIEFYMQEIKEQYDRTNQHHCRIK